MTQASQLHILQVQSRWEGVSRMSCCMALMFVALSTGLVSVLYELLVYNVRDRDFRDILFDHRVTHAGRTASHVFFKDTLAGLSSLPSSAAAIANSGVPVVMEYCQSRESEACTVLFDHTQAAVGNLPRNCSRRGMLVWSDRIHVREALDHSAAVLTVTTQGNDAVKLQLSANSSHVPSAYEVLEFIELVKARHGNRRWVSPEDMSLPYVNGSSLVYRSDGVEGGTRTKWGIEEDISWFGACPNTSWNSTFFYAVAKVSFPPLQTNTTQELAVTFNNRHYYAPLYNVSTEQSESNVRRLRQVTLGLSLVSALPCNAWRVSSFSTHYINETGLGRYAERKVVLMTKDFTQPDAVKVPIYAGQFYIIVGLFCGCFVVAGVVVLLVSWSLVTWNLRALHGREPPWWGFRLNRGW
eukprot:jgi/Ulvmu1/3136/UM015_0176.1